VWSASLAARGVAPFRPAFDDWLIGVRAQDWHLVDAWLAAAAWAKSRPA
jgi:hypothetical protein